MSEQHTGVSFYIRKYGKCILPYCNHPRTKYGLFCINHDGEDEDLPPSGVDLVYSYAIKCIVCPYEQGARGTREQERVTRLFGLPPCPKCGSVVTIEDEGQIVGRMVKEHST